MTHCGKILLSLLYVPVIPGESCPQCGLTAGNYVPSPHHLPPGTVLLGRYLVGRALGEGGFGITYIGYDLRLELKVAIKEYYPVDRATRNSAVSLSVTSFVGPSSQSFQRGKEKYLVEARAMAKMDKQQAIVSVRDFFEEITPPTSSWSTSMAPPSATWSNRGAASRPGSCSPCWSRFLGIWP